ncbi:hypothetical protein Cgig2_003933 [Carnegiea gigantea]|uniref:Uncharacterized protein n=1 Tax=Carnegiea gigantea TaxID=171969 RepID=A0A9Q1KAV5_9CARY|nr:hypothetical protein Cgig2_003933 [Carnegiea gigantea]
MAGAPSTSLSPPIKRPVGAPKSAILVLFRPKVSAGAPFNVRFSADCYRRRLSTCSSREPQCPVVPEGPSCIFVGSIETASQETLEALYRQARDAYYSGVPLIVDDMFDRVELKLRLYGSKYVVKYPRCSLRRQSAYADAQEDPSQMFALASIWSLILVFGGSVCLVPMLYTIGLAYQDAFNTATLNSSQSTTVEFLGMLTCALFMLLGSVIGCPIASASGNTPVLQFIFTVAYVESIEIGVVGSIGYDL